MKRAALVGVLLIAALATSGSATAAPLCRDARPGADRFTRHLVRAWTVDATDAPRHIRYHKCGRWHRDPSRLWFAYSAQDPLLGRVSWWVRATWHETYWHYYNQGLGVTLDPSWLS